MAEACHAPGELAAAQLQGGLAQIRADQRASRPEGAASAGKRVGEIIGIHLRMMLDKGRQIVGHPRKRAFGVRGEGQQEPRAARRIGQQGRRFLQNYVRIGTADAKRADSGAARCAPPPPGNKLRGNEEGAMRKVDGRIGRLEVQAGRNLAVFQSLDGLDEPRHTRSGIQMTDVGLDRTDGAASGFHRAKGVGQRPDLDGITQRGAGAVRLQIADGGRIDAGCPQCLADYLGLAVHAGCGEADLVRAVVVDGGSANDRQNRIAFFHCGGELFQGHQTRSGTAHRACRGAVKGPAVAVWREDEALVIEIAGRAAGLDAGSSGQRQFALAFQHGAGGQMHRHQRGGAGGVDVEAGPIEIQLVGNTGGDKFLAVKQADLEVGRDVGMSQSRQQVFLEVGIRANADKYANAAFVGGRIAAGALQRLPGDFQQVPLLRIAEFRLARRHVEEVGVKQRNAVKLAVSGHKTRMPRDFPCKAGGQQFFLVVETDRFHTGGKVLPEFIRRGGPGKMSGHADNRNGFFSVRRSCGYRLRRTLACGIWCAVENLRQTRYGGVVEEVGHFQAVVQLPLNQSPYPHQQQGIAPQLEEVVMDADALQIEHRAENLFQGLFGCAPRSDVGGIPRDFRFRQAAEINFAVCGQRKIGDLHDDCGNHVVRQLAFQIAAQFGHFTVADHIGAQPPLRASSEGGNYGAADEGMLAQNVFNFTQLDTETADLHLVIKTSQKAQSS